MAPKAKGPPKGQRTATPNLISDVAPKLVQFLKDGLGGKEVSMVKAPDGSIQHAEIQFGDSRIFVGQERLARPAMACRVYLFVEDVDKTYTRAMKADAVGLNPPHDAFYGDRVAVIRDPAGNVWTLAKRKENLSDKEQERRLRDLSPKGSM